MQIEALLNAIVIDADLPIDRLPDLPQIFGLYFLTLDSHPQLPSLQ
ncbi:MAG: hypothetical protein ETSY1_04040 [Candidatus Entotheonella factor]|uniref:Uncharacterized protein n=1 Tax=Entotheonella factor TaxID=1429438 RepID=W4LX59_ENTF1|nr:MAG: hypothetical protein ETSY1_04040 [Candidatus Entotheonella factor]